ncbi:undecaprenyl-phosphate galactose phosphotransferase WbaP [Acidobacteriota bacterium]
MKKKIISLIFLVASDSLAVLLSFVSAYLLSSKILPLAFPSLLQETIFLETYLGQIHLLGVWFVVFLYEKLYTKRFSFWDETRTILKSTTISFALIMITVFIVQQDSRLSRLTIILAWLFSLILLPVFRYMIKILLVKLTFWKKSVILIGSEKSLTFLLKAIKKNRVMGYEAVGCLSDDRKKTGQSISGVKILGHIDEIEKWKEATGFEDIIVNLPDFPRDELIRLLKKWDYLSETIRYIPRMGDLIAAGIEIENIGDILSLTVRKNLLKPLNVLIKSIFEFALALCLFILFLPFFVTIFLAIKFDSKSSAFFIQTRLGKKGKTIKLLKFRSMHLDADRRLDKYLKENPEARNEWLEYKKLRSYDPRVTRVGKILRKYSLDELPQLINVLKGNMGLVGPRPYIEEELEENKPDSLIFFEVKPGITGLWQISGRSLLPFKERLFLDEYYVRNWTFWIDIVILIKTVKVAALGKGAV